MRGFLPHPARVVGAATAALLLTLPVLTATRYAGWRADLRTVTTASVLVAAAGAFLLAARFGARRPPGRFPVRLAVALAGVGLLAAGYLAAAHLFHRLVVPVAVDGAPGALPARGLVLALLAGALGVALGALWRRPAVLASLLVVLLAGELVLHGPVGFGPFSAARYWLFGVGQPHDIPGCTSVVPAECVTWTYRHWPAGLVLAGGVLVALLAAALAARWPANGDAEPAEPAEPTESVEPAEPAGPADRDAESAGATRTGPSLFRRYAPAAGLVVAGLVLAPLVIGTGAQHATSEFAESIGTSAPVGSPAEVPVPAPGRLAVFAVGLEDVGDCRAASADGSRVALSPVIGTVRYGDSVSYRWVGTFRLPTPGRWTVTCGGDAGEYLVAGVPRVGGLVGRLVEAPRPVGWLLGASPGLLVAAYTAVGRRRRG
ncbi:hypothetical protein [Micromonospora costi]|uniref:hypothetical protein n=1 Tax=Micromonospora costi TaxID=1530042 RepID=UPI0011C44896|nr:hypothetical protein [Micromonospora costi]